MIYVSICSYRDSDLFNTVHSLLENAHRSEMITIYVLVQDVILNPLYFYSQIKSEYRNQVTFDVVPFQQAKGPLFARQYIIKNMIMKNLDLERKRLVGSNGKDYFLQLDSHMRFCESWDKLLIEYWFERLYAEKKIVTFYPPPHGYSSEEKIPVMNTKIKSIVSDSCVFRAEYWDKRSIDKYYQSRYVAAGFFFTDLDHVLKYYPLDEPFKIPFLFEGEEWLLFKIFQKNGFYFFPPNFNICTHFYYRKGHAKVWDDLPFFKTKSLEAVVKLRQLDL